VAQSGILKELVFEEIARDLLRPVGITHAGDGSGRLFITQQRGQLMVHDGAQLQGTPFLNISSKVRCCGESGLLSVAFHPDYEANGYFYVFYTGASEQPETIFDSIVSRFQVSQVDPNRADPNSEKVILRVPQPGGDHNAGQLQFGPQGYLYISTGDGGVDPREFDTAQDLTNLLGSILRIDVDGGDPYAIPPTNPFAGLDVGKGLDAGKEEIWSYGFRNPWRFSFDRDTGDMFIADVGSGQFEEVDFQPAGSPGGENYGWTPFEGTSCFLDNPLCDEIDAVAPILEYAHVPDQSHPFTSDCGGAITGGYRYRGPSMPGFQGVYFYGDFCNGFLYGATQGPAGWSANEPLDTEWCFSSFGEDEDGEVYVVDHLGGDVLRVVTDAPMPRLTGISSEGSIAGSAAFAMTVSGSMFVPGSEVWWNGEARPTRFIDNDRLQVMIAADDVAAEGAAQVSVFSPAPGGGLSEAREFLIAAATGEQPMLNVGGVVNAASFAAGQALAAGSIVAAFGTNLAAGEGIATATPLPTALRGSSAQFHSGARGAYLYGSEDQLNLQIPWGLEGEEGTTLAVRLGANEREAMPLALAAFNPGIFTVNQQGTGQGAILVAGSGGTLAGPKGLPAVSRPVRKGEFLSIFCTGLGPVKRTPETGFAATSIPNSTTTLPTVTIGGVEARVTFAGLAPGFVGLYQINVEVPPGAPTGDQVEVVVTIGGIVANIVTIAVE
jgi:uncharacterized protein (TIGR03437 family)